MGNEAPLIETLRVDLASVGATADLTSPVGFAPFAGVVAAVRYIPTSVLTGADTNSRTCTLYNRGQGGSGTTVVATKAFTAGQNAPANDATAIPLSGTPANLAVAQGDVLDFESLHVGASGLADPGGVIEVDISRG